jgi:hypothetical protein
MLKVAEKVRPMCRGKRGSTAVGPLSSVGSALDELYM